MNKFRGEDGQVLILTVLSLAVVLGFVAFAADVGLMLRQRRIEQAAADSAAIAGAAEISYSDVSTGAQNDALQNGVPTSAVTVNNPPTSGPHAGAGNSGYVEVIVSQSKPTFFANLFNRSSMTISARAVATNVPTPACIYTLGSASPDTNDSPVGGIDVTGSADLELPTCGIVDNATGSFAVHVTGGATLKASSIGIVGSDTVHNGGVLQPNPPITGIAATSDPLSSIAPVVPPADYATCTALTINASTTIGPASPSGSICYSSLTVSKGSPVITLNPGLYVFNGPGGMNIGSGTIMNGTGVTFYFRNGAGFNFTNGATANLSAPTLGNYSGLLFYQDAADNAADSFVGGSTGGVSGIFYLPSANLTLANGTATTFTVDLVIGSLSMSGNATLAPYAPINGASPLSTPRLVE